MRQLLRPGFVTPALLLLEAFATLALIGDLHAASRPRPVVAPSSAALPCCKPFDESFYVAPPEDGKTPQN